MNKINKFMFKEGDIEYYNSKLLEEFEYIVNRSYKMITHVTKKELAENQIRKIQDITIIHNELINCEKYRKYLYDKFDGFRYNLNNAEGKFAQTYYRSHKDFFKFYIDDISKKEFIKCIK